MFEAESAAAVSVLSAAFVTEPELLLVYELSPYAESSDGAVVFALFSMLSGLGDEESADC
ncbi:hypothetical protein BGM20_00010 [Alkalicoccobacillus gibsonii]|nr:hypothetical protein BGM20_00010 [Alkalicoccobacillus gibsonii]